MDETRAGVSDDEGMDRVLAAFRRGIESARARSYAAMSSNETDTPSGKRPMSLRNITGLGSTLDGSRPSGTNRVKIRSAFSSLIKKSKDKHHVDHQKSAQLMAELLAGAPAALVLASMYQRDEHDHRKIPVLLEQLKIRIPESQLKHDTKNARHLIFKVELEYGNGDSRMKWTISRSLQDFVNLHVKYQAAGAKDKLKHLRRDDKSRVKMPHFPRSAFPYARNWRGLFDTLGDEDEEDEAEEDAHIVHDVQNAPPTPGTIGGSEPLSEIAESPSPTPNSGFNFQPSMHLGSTTPGPKMEVLGALGKHKRDKSAANRPFGPRRMSTIEMGKLPEDPEELEGRQREIYTRRQRRKLETYLQQMIRWLIFRPASTRLCKFLELSALAVRLSAEGKFQGKQGLLTIASRRNREVRRKPFSLQAFADRHRPRWFLVRQSYVVCVDGPESLNPYDVFLVDSDFVTEKRRNIADQKTPVDVAKAVVEKTPTSMHGKHLMLRLYNSEGKLKLLARTERQYHQFHESINLMASATVWSKKQRFGSFAPVRDHVLCRWLVDGRDHMWQVSRAIDNAKSFIYIHDWWLSPELFLRRPAAASAKWRLDRLLQRKAEEGVKIFVIVYRNIESTIPIDSEYTKSTLLDLHENITIQRSPNQYRQTQFFWAHHEKLVVVDNMMAFVGGVDLCFGRWDDSCHSLTDDKEAGLDDGYEGPRDSQNCQVWPGKDYSNPRVQDFKELGEPFKDMYRRDKVPRMPWHDISMQMVGQSASDVGRHFVQRWNYVLKSRIPSRPTPVLIPPPEYEQHELDAMGLTGTCQVQILRSCSPWSIGTPNKVECSIMNAYVHLIKHSQHFVYVENQFFISSCTVEGTQIHNKIGDALVERILRAHANDEDWAACLVIPLMPGFESSVDSQDGSSVRLIMECQYRSICRGEESIFGRLRAQGIEPQDYIRFYSLRQWGKIGPKQCLISEQLYVHAKCIVVDDRSAIIGSANINERSMLGSRDSEVAAMVTDMRMLPSHMGGEPYEVGEFPHTLRKRLMREHLGLDIDMIYRRHEMERREEAEKVRQAQDQEMDRIYRDRSTGEGDYFGHDAGKSGLEVNGHRTGVSKSRAVPDSTANITSNASSQDLMATRGTNDPKLSSQRPATDIPNSRPSVSDKSGVQQTPEQSKEVVVEGYGASKATSNLSACQHEMMDSYVDDQGREAMLSKHAPDVERVRSQEAEQQRRSESLERQKRAEHNTGWGVRPPYPSERADTHALGLPVRSALPELPLTDDTDINGPPLTRGVSGTSSDGPRKVFNPLLHDIRQPEIHEDCMQDPLADSFFREVWHRVAENNTQIYRQIFRCMPDSEVMDWKQYEKFNEYNERFMQSQGMGPSKPSTGVTRGGPPGSAASTSTTTMIGAAEGNSKKGKLAVLSGKMRPGSRAEDEKPHMEVLNEKEAELADEKVDAKVRASPQVSEASDESPRSEQDIRLPAEGAQSFDGATRHHNLSSVSVDTEKAALGQQCQLKKSQDSEFATPVTASTTRPRTITYSADLHSTSETTAVQPASASDTTTAGGLQPSLSQKRNGRRRGTSSAKYVPEEVMGREEAEKYLRMVKGNLVLWPYDWFVSRSCCAVSGLSISDLIY